MNIHMFFSFVVLFVYFFPRVANRPAIHIPVPAANRILFTICMKVTFVGDSHHAGDISTGLNKKHPKNS